MSVTKSEKDGKEKEKGNPGERRKGINVETTGNKQNIKG